MSTPAIRGPVPPYSNVNINAQFYQPSALVISNISLGVTTTITTTENNDYVIGQLVRLIIPPTFGSRQLNDKQGYVLSIPADNQVVVSIDSSRNVDQFVSSSATTKPQILPIGDINNGTTNVSGRLSTGTFIPGSFVDISP